MAGLGLFIGACGSAVAAATPEVRFDGRISERSAERSAQRPLTLMNSARRGVAGVDRRARKENAGARPALEIGEDCDLEPALEDPDFAAGANPQDRCVPFTFRRVALTMER
jgi:hypothetical protein